MSLLEDALQVATITDQMDWVVLISKCSREANLVADKVAKKAFNITFGLQYNVFLYLCLVLGSC